jgi:hypothetical protein
MNLFTQNSDLRKTGIFGWTLPAHWVKLSDGSKFNTCPNAGICAAFCYAKNGTYMFSNVKKVHLEKLELVLFQREKWKSMINEELKLKKYIGKYIRIHDAGDFFDKQYALDWIEIAENNKQCVFYSYTKEVSLFKSIENLPNNFILIYSFGGKEDHLIDRNNDRHSDVFPNHDEMIKAGYNDINEDDKQAAINENFRVGLYRNNIKHFIKKMGDKKFSEWQKGERPTKNTLF